MVDKPKVHSDGVDAVVAEHRRAGAVARRIKIGRANYVCAERNGSRMLIRVRATGEVKDVKFTVYPKDAQAVAALASVRASHGIWAFVCLGNGAADIRYEKASTVTVLAQQDEINYLGTNLYHIGFEQLTVCIHRIGELLAPVSPAA
jgi:hypothetical protein